MKVSIYVLINLSHLSQTARVSWLYNIAMFCWLQYCRTTYFLPLCILLDFVAVVRQILGFPSLQQLRPRVRERISTRANSKYEVINIGRQLEVSANSYSSTLNWTHNSYECQPVFVSIGRQFQSSKLNWIYNCRTIIITGGQQF